MCHRASHFLAYSVLISNVRSHSFMSFSSVIYVSFRCSCLSSAARDIFWKAIRVVFDTRLSSTIRVASDLIIALLLTMTSRVTMLCPASKPCKAW